MKASKLCRERHLAKTHRGDLRRGERFRIGQKLRAYPSYLRVEMRQISYNVSCLGISLYALAERDRAKRVAGRTRLEQFIVPVFWPKV